MTKYSQPPPPLTVREMIDLLQALPEDQKDLPIGTVDRISVVTELNAPRVTYMHSDGSEAEEDLENKYLVKWLVL